MSRSEKHFRLTGGKVTKGVKAPHMNWFCVEGRKAVLVSRTEKHFSSDRREGHKRGEGPPYELVLCRGQKSPFVLGHKSIFRLTAGKGTKGV